MPARIPTKLNSSWSKDSGEHKTKQRCENTWRKCDVVRMKRLQAHRPSIDFFGDATWRRITTLWDNNEITREFSGSKFNSIVPADSDWSLEICRARRSRRLAACWWLCPFLRLLPAVSKPQIWFPSLSKWFPFLLHCSQNRALKWSGSGLLTSDVTDFTFICFKLHFTEAVKVHLTVLTGEGLSPNFW